ncbi:uncharacterized protein LOC109824600 isoform X1 [Asparagus officinalis]|nr:uncharacterized protein LOC109824600 isoform X1 [Asparagus officinalis]XP_020246819.1 uncharacterized protein LOC109824600 isoform X1 [Asparagus officinalis]
MGCASSIPKTLPSGGRKKRKNRSSVDEVVVFVPMLQVPMPVDFLHPLRGLLSRELIDKLSSLRYRIVSLSEENDLADVNDVAALQQALEEYLPILLGLTVKEHNLESLVEFKWRVLCEDEEETCIDSAWYEVLSVVHLMATLSMLQANLMLLPNKSSDECERVVSEDSKKFAVDLLLKASGCLDYCLRGVMVNLPLHLRKNLPHGMQEGMLEAMSTQALAQGVEMQLGLALECEKATLSVKRRLACEAVSYFAQAHSCLTGCYTNDGYGKKLLLFIQWKYLEAKAAAYYYHGLVLDKGSAPSDHVSAVCCLFAAEELLRDGKKACLSFCLAAPVTRVPPAWGVMKHVNKKIPETASKKAQIYGYLFEQDKGCQSLPDLPEFQLSLKPDDYNVPDIDASWDNEKFEPQIQSLKEHLKDEDEIVET